MIFHCLRHWVQHMHVDGFRFDLASILSRNQDGEPCRTRRSCSTSKPTPCWPTPRSSPRRGTPPGCTRSALSRRPLGRVERPVIATTCAASWRGDAGASVPQWPTAGRQRNLFQHSAPRPPCRSVNFVTSHDGFTLNDLVSYNDKHNEANGEDNRDGTTTTTAGTAASKAPPTTRGIEALRRRQIKNFLTPAAHVPGTADAADGRRSAPHAARQQQRLLPGQRNSLVRLGRRRRRHATSSDSPAD